MGIGVEPLSSFLRGGLGIGHAGAVQHKQRGVTHGVACPGEVGGDLGVAVAVDDVGAKDLVGVVAARHGTAHRDGTGRGRRGLRGSGEHDRAGADQEGKQRKQDREGANFLFTTLASLRIRLATNVHPAAAAQSTAAPARYVRVTPDIPERGKEVE